MDSLKWLERFVPDVETAIALFTMNFPQKDTMFVWVDLGILDSQNKPIYRLVRRVDLEDSKKFPGVFAAYTAEEFQTVLPLNFMPMQMRLGVWIIVDAYGTKFHDQEAKDNSPAARQIVMSRVSGSNANRPAEAFAKAAIFLIQSGLLKIG